MRERARQYGSWFRHSRCRPRFNMGSMMQTMRGHWECETVMRATRRTSEVEVFPNQLALGREPPCLPVARHIQTAFLVTSDEPDAHGYLAT